MPSANQEFFTQQGAYFTQDNSLQHFGLPFGNAFAYCHHLSVLTIIGDDALKFLQGQVTCDMTAVQQGEPRFGAHLNLQGRVLFAFWIIPNPDAQGFRIILPQAMVASVKEHWAKYLMFSRSTLSVEENTAVIMALPNQATHIAQALTISATSLNHNDTWQHFSALGCHYFIAATSTLIEQWPTLTALGSAGGTQQAQWWDIEAGLAHIYPGAAQQFLPQILNYDLFHGVSFNKGCYTGQEIVARMKFKGQLKQRLHRVSWPEPMAALPGATLRNEAGRALGQVVVSLEHDGAQHALAVLRRDHELPTHLEEKAITLTQVDLPYALPDVGQ